MYARPHPHPAGKPVLIHNSQDTLPQPASKGSIVVLHMHTEYSCLGSTRTTSTVYNLTSGDFPAKNTLYTLYIYMLLANPSNESLHCIYMVLKFYSYRLLHIRSHTRCQVVRPLHPSMASFLCCMHTVAHTHTHTSTHTLTHTNTRTHTLSYTHTHIEATKSAINILFIPYSHICTQQFPHCAPRLFVLCFQARLPHQPRTHTVVKIKRGA